MPVPENVFVEDGHARPKIHLGSEGFQTLPIVRKGIEVYTKFSGGFETSSVRLRFVIPTKVGILGSICANLQREIPASAGMTLFFPLT